MNPRTGLTAAALAAILLLAPQPAIHLLAPQPLTAQTAPAPGDTASARQSTSRLFADEATGGAIGSAAGLVAGGLAGYYLMKLLPCERVRCGMALFGGLVVGGTGLAAAGAYVGGRRADGEPSALGAGLGAAAGMVGGYVVAGLLEDLGLPLPIVVLAYPAAQGAFAAAGSRIVVQIR